jgi:hypothetical protein
MPAPREFNDIKMGADHTMGEGAHGGFGGDTIMNGLIDPLSLALPLRGRECVQGRNALLGL